MKTHLKYNGTGLPPEGKPIIGKPGDDRSHYIAGPSLVTAVNTAILLGSPLLITGEAGVGKSALAYAVATELGLGPVEAFHTRSDHQARDLLYDLDHLLRFYDAHVPRPQEALAPAGSQGEESQQEPVKDLSHYLRLRPLGRAIKAASEGTQKVVLIDEIDKAPRDFPNDLLEPLESLSFTVEETGQRFEADRTHRPIVILTSNKERELPDAFLRRCIYHNIDFPEDDELLGILRAHKALKDIEGNLLKQALRHFKELRERLQRPPATDELIKWLKLLTMLGIESLPDTVEDVQHLEVVVKTLEDRQTLGLSPKER